MSINGYQNINSKLTKEVDYDAAGMQIAEKEGERATFATENDYVKCVNWRIKEHKGREDALLSTNTRKPRGAKG